MSTAIMVISEPGNYFSIFYQVAFLIPFFLLMIVGMKRKYNMTSWLVIVLSSAFFFLLGTRILTFTGSEWNELFGSGTFPQSHNKFALGGLIVALPMIELTRRFLKFDKPVLSVFAWVAPIGLAIQKAGCLMYGCCYGVITDLPWGIRYSEGMPPYVDQLNTGLIGSGTTLSHAIHPTQMYQMIAYLGITVIVLFTLNRFRSEFRTVIFALLLLLTSRFLIEFTLDSNTLSFGADYFLGMKVIQWFCIIPAIAIFFLLIKKVEPIVRPVESKQLMRFPQLRTITTLILITVLFIVLHEFFSTSETIAFNIRFLIIISLLAISLFFRVKSTRNRIASALLLILPFILLSQTVEEEKLPYEKSRSLSLGSSFGSYFNEVKYNPHEGCSGDIIYDRADFKNTKTSFLGGYTSSGIYGTTNYRYGSFLSAGKIKEYSYLDDENKDIIFAYASPFAEYNWRWFGAGVELDIGFIPNTRLSPYDGPYLPEDNNRILPILPGASFRLGPHDIFYFRFDYNYTSGGYLPQNLMSLSAGTGLGSKKMTGLRAGLILHSENYFIEGDFWLSKNFGLYGSYMRSRIYTEGMEYASHLNLGVKINLQD